MAYHQTAIAAVRIVPRREEWSNAARALFGKISFGSMKHTRRLARLVEEALRREAVDPGRDEFRKTLNRIVKVAEELASLLDSHDVRSLAPELWDALAQPGAESARVLSRVVVLAQHRLDSLPGGGGRVGAGAAFGKPGAHIQCAAAIVEVWRWRGRRAVNTDQEAMMACAALWRLASGPVTDRVRSDAEPTPGMWDRHLRAAVRRPTQPPSRRRRGEPAKLKLESRELTRVGIARDRARCVLDGSSVRFSHGK